MFYGPRAVAMDFQFSNQHLFGLPERASSFLLNDTISIYEGNFSDPFRLYNLDVASYKVGEP